MIYNMDAVKPFKWEELHGKILKIAVAAPSPETLELTGQVFALDVETGQMYCLLEFDLEGKPLAR